MIQRRRISNRKSYRRIRKQQKDAERKEAADRLARSQAEWDDCSSWVRMVSALAGTSSECVLFDAIVAVWPRVWLHAQSGLVPVPYELVFEALGEDAKRVGATSETTRSDRLCDEIRARLPVSPAWFYETGARFKTTK